MTATDRSLQADAIVELRVGGMKCREIAERVGCNAYRVWYVLRSRGAGPARDRAQWLLMRIFGPSHSDR